MQLHTQLIYAGIGSRETPDFILKAMYNFAQFMAKDYNAILRSGGAKGADTAFIKGAKSKNGKVENYLPFPNYNGYKDGVVPMPKGCMELARKYHPNWKACSDGAKLMHARNCMIALGPYLVLPVHFIVCWTPNAEITGGTGQALRLALDYYIPVCNLGTCKTMDEAVEKLNNLSSEIKKGLDNANDNIFNKFTLGVI